jgi:hypothetical protein
MTRDRNGPSNLPAMVEQETALLPRSNRWRFLARCVGLLALLTMGDFGKVPFRGSTSNADVTATNGTTPRRTREEQQLVDDLGRLSGKPLTEQEANLAIAQARAFGEL